MVQKNILLNGRFTRILLKLSFLDTYEDFVSKSPLGTDLEHSDSRQHQQILGQDQYYDHLMLFGSHILCDVIVVHGIFYGARAKCVQPSSVMSFKQKEEGDMYSLEAKRKDRERNIRNKEVSDMRNNGEGML